MDVVFTLSNLLFDHERVVLSGLGVFTTEIEKAYIHPVSHTFSPEFKKIRFQFDESAKDEQLAAKMAVPDAAKIIEAFVIKVKKELKEGKKVQLKNIGYLLAHHTGEVILEQDRSFNYVKKNFGLQSFTQEPVKKVPVQEAPLAAVTTAKKESKKLPLAWIFSIAAVVLIGVLIAWQWNRIEDLINPKNDIAQTEENRPANNTQTTSSQAAVVVDTVEEVQDEEMIAVEEDTTSDQEQTAMENEVPEPDSNAEEMVEDSQVDNTELASSTEGESAVVQEYQGPVYYVIAGCFESQAKAERLLKELQDDGFDQAEIKGKIGRLHRVCYITFPTRRQASDYMLKLQRAGRKGVWIQKGRSK